MPKQCFTIRRVPYLSNSCTVLALRPRPLKASNTRAERTVISILFTLIHLTMLIRITIRSNIIAGAIFKILSRSFYAEILALQGFPAGLRDSYFIRDKADYSEIQDNQSFSIAGSRKGFGDPRGTLFFELARLAEARKPSYLLFENVPYALLHIRYRTCIQCSTMAQLSGDCSTPRSTRAKPKQTSFWLWRSPRRALTRSTRSSGKRPSGIIRRSPSAPFCCGWG